MGEVELLVVGLDLGDVDIHRELGGQWGPQPSDVGSGIRPHVTVVGRDPCTWETMFPREDV